MIIYLVQHAEATVEEEDPSRPLSGKGLSEIRKTGSYLSRLNLGVDKIFHSTKLRAKQTAEVLAGGLRASKGLSEADGLNPLDDPNIWAERLKDIPGDVALVGHLPHLARLASLLLTESVQSEIVSFRMAGVVCITRDNQGTCMLQWILTPAVILEEGERSVCDGL
jgi:phosphohistidine phosphatase